MQIGRRYLTPTPVEEDEAVGPFHARFFASRPTTPRVARCTSCRCAVLLVYCLLVTAIVIGEQLRVFSLGGLSRRFYGSRIVPVAPCKAAPQHYLAMMTIFKNMKPYLQEWIEFHTMVGFQHFFLYNNNSTDSPEEELNPYIKLGIVTMRFFPSQYRIAYDGTVENFSQKAALLDALTRYRCTAKWIALLDMDEFVFSASNTQLPALLRRYEHYGGLSLAWLRFGTSNNVLPPAALTIEGYTYRMERPTNNFKNIVQPARVSGLIDVHDILYHSGYYSVDERQRPISMHTNQNVDHSFELFRLHHYFTRSYLDWFLRVYDRGSVSGAYRKFKLNDLKHYGRANEMYDASAQFLAKELKRRMNFNGTEWRRRYFSYGAFLSMIGPT